MVELKLLELQRLSSLFSELNLEKTPGPLKQALTTGEKNLALDILRSKFPDLFSGLEERQLKDDNFLIKFLSNPLNRNKIRDKVLRNLPIAQYVQLAKSLEQPVVAEEGEQPASEEGQAEQAATMQTPTETVGTTSSDLPGGLLSVPAISSPSAPRIIHIIPHTPEPTKPEIAIANKSGVAVEKPPLKSELVTASKSGVVAEPPPSKIYIANKSGAAVEEHPITPKRFNFSSIKSSFSSSFGGFKNFGSRAGVFFQRNAGKYFTTGRIATVVSGGIGAITGGALTNGSAAGIFGGAIGGAALPPWLKSREGMRFLGRAGNDIINTGVRFSNQVSTEAGRLSAKAGSKRLAWGLVGFLLFLVIIGGAIGGLTGGTTPTGTGSSGGTTAAADISNCKFTRSGDSVKELTYKSPLLLSYIQEASNLTGIPAVVLAAFIRVETSSTVTKTVDEIKNLSCSQSPTGALGIMQIQPPGTTSLRGDPASCDDCIDAGAKLVGKTVSSMTRQDYCDPKTSIIVGAGWILKKMSKLGYGDGTKWDPAWTNDRKAIEALVNTYYGCFLYGGQSDCTGPYNYADDVTTSIQSCKPVTSTAPGQPVGAILASDVDQAKNFLNAKWGLNMVGNWSLNRLQLMIDKLSEYSLTRSKFVENIKGEKIELIYTGFSNQLSGHVQLREYPGEDGLFIAALAHELGHVIYNNRPNTISFKAEHNSLHASSGQAISSYNVEGITAFSDKSENYAELIAYCVTGRPIYSALTPGILVYKDLGAKIAGGCN